MPRFERRSASESWDPLPCTAATGRVCEFGAVSSRHSIGAICASWVGMDRTAALKLALRRARVALRLQYPETGCRCRKV
jgi:hypothetical protein